MEKEITNNNENQNRIKNELLENYTNYYKLQPKINNKRHKSAENTGIFNKYETNNNRNTNKQLEENIIIKTNYLRLNDFNNDLNIHTKSKIALF